jgi:hypothetical protein
VSEWLEHFKHQLACGALNVFVTEVKDPKRRDLRREAEVLPPLSPPSFDHFDWWSPMLVAGVHYVHVKVKLQRGRRDGGEVCEALQAALAELDASPGRAQCIAERGRALARSLSMERVHGYMAGVLRAAATSQKHDLAQQLVAGGAAAHVTRRNFGTLLSESTRPWMERIFLPAHGVGGARANASRKGNTRAASSHTRPLHAKLLHGFRGSGLGGVQRTFSR